MVSMENTNTKEQIDMCKEQVASCLANFQDFWNNGQTRYAFHEADTMTVRLRELCDMLQI